MDLQRPAAPRVLARAELDQSGLIHVGVLARNLFPRERAGEDRGGIAFGVGDVIKPVIREPAPVLVEEPDPFAQPFQQLSVGLRAGLLDIRKESILADIHRLIGAERGQDAGHHSARFDRAVIAQVVGGVVGRADHLDVRASDQPARGIAVGRQQFVRPVVDPLRRFGGQHLVDPEIAFQFELRPMEQGVSDRVGQHRRVGEKLVPVGGVARDILLLDPERAHRAPLVVVAAEHQFGDPGETVILRDLFRRDVAMIVDDRKTLGKLVIEFLRGLVFQHEIFGKEVHFGFRPFG